MTLRRKVGGLLLLRQKRKGSATIRQTHTKLYYILHFFDEDVKNLS